jgi:multiple sugar transport system substrate-binding protein
VLCLPRIADEQRAAAAWQIVRYLSDHGVAWARGGQVPARISQRQSPEFQALTAQAVFAGSVDAVRYVPNVPTTAAIVRDVRFACEEVLRGAALPEEALTKAQAAVEATLARDREMAAVIRAQGESKL